VKSLDVGVTLYNTDGEIVSQVGGEMATVQRCVRLADLSTGEIYILYVMNGKLTMHAESEE